MSIEDYNTDAIDLAFDYLDTYNSSPDGSNEIKETANKCYITDEVDDFTVESVPTGEVCTIELAKSYGIFGKDKYFNDLLQEQNNIKTYNNDNDSDTLPFSLCSVENDVAYTNCTLSTKNPWKSLSKDNKYCMLPIGIALPNGLKYNEDSVTIEKPPNIPYIETKNNICHERWYDWFSIPDYHLGNHYTSNETSGKCMKPCKIGNIAIDQDNCTNREGFARGFYSKDFYYLPISLVLLLGSTKDTLIKRHKQEITKYRSAMKGISLDYDMYNSIMTDETTQNNIYNTIKSDLKLHINNFLNRPFDDTFIMPPSNSIQKLSSVKKIMTKINITEAYNIAAKFFILSNNKKREDDFMKWKKDLSDINGYDITDDKFYKQLLILKKACNVLFDNKSSYSRDFVLYTLNIDLPKSEVPKQPIVFEITDNDLMMAISNNSAAVPVDKMDLLEESSRRQQKTKSSESRTDVDKSQGGAPITKKEESDKLDSTLALSRKGSSKGGTSNTLAQIIAITAVVFFIIFVVIIVILLGNFFWYYVAEFLNMLIISFAYLIFGIRDLFRMKWTPSALNMEIAELQKTFVNKKIMSDLSRIKKS